MSVLHSCSQGQTEVDMYLPKGKWYDYQTVSPINKQFRIAGSMHSDLAVYMLYKHSSSTLSAAIHYNYKHQNTYMFSE